MSLLEQEDALGACTCFSGKVKGFACAWGIEIWAAHGVGGVSLQGDSSLVVCVFFFWEYLNVASCSWHAGVGHNVPHSSTSIVQEFRSQ